MSPGVQAKVDTIYGIAARNDVHGSGPNAEVVQGTIEGVKVDWADAAKRKPVWLQRFKDEVIGGSGKPTDVTPPR